MNRKLFSLATAALCLFLQVGVSNADVLIGDFEGGSMDGFGPNGANTLTSSTTGVSSGSGAARFDAPNGGWGPRFEMAILGHADETAILADIASTGSKVVADVTGFGGAPENPAWWAQLGLLVNADGHWGVHTLQGVGLGGSTNTYEWVIPDAAKAGIANGKASDTWANIGFLSNGGTPTTLYIDNIRIVTATAVPEPTSLGLLGLGGLALVARRRRKIA